jgi:hypothetical protein
MSVHLGPEYARVRRVGQEYTLVQSDTTVGLVDALAEGSAQDCFDQFTEVRIAIIPVRLREPCSRTLSIMSGGLMRSEHYDD